MNFKYIAGFLIVELTILFCLPVVSYAARKNKPELIQKNKLEFIKITTSKTEENAITIKWSTTEQAQGKLRYGKKYTELNDTLFDVAFSTNHVFTLTGLDKATDYFYRITAFSNNTSITSAIRNFRTKGEFEPVFIENSVNDIKIDSCRLSWVLNTPCKVKLKYSPAGEINEAVIEIGKYYKSGILEMTNLYPETTYYYKLEGTDRSGRTVKSKTGTFKTAENNIALNKKVTGTFTNILNDPYFDAKKNQLQKVTDGIYNYYGGMAVSGNPAANDQYVIIDLGKTCRIDKIIVYWRSLAYSKDYSVELSTDRSIWDTVAMNQDPDAGGESVRSEKGDPMKFLITYCRETLARYVKLFIAKNSEFYRKDKTWDFVQLMEVKVIPVVDER